MIRSFNPFLNVVDSNKASDADVALGVRDDAFVTPRGVKRKYDSLLADASSTSQQLDAAVLVAANAYADQKVALDSVAIRADMDLLQDYAQGRGEAAQLYSDQQDAIQTTALQAYADTKLLEAKNYTDLQNTQQTLAMEAYADSILLDANAHSDDIYAALAGSIAALKAESVAMDTNGVYQASANLYMNHHGIANVKSIVVGGDSVSNSNPNGFLDNPDAPLLMFSTLPGQETVWAGIYPGKRREVVDPKYVMLESGGDQTFFFFDHVEVQGHGSFGEDTTPSKVVPCAILQAHSTTKGFLPPRMTAAERGLIDTPVDGLIVYATDTNQLSIFANGTWRTLMWS